MLPTIATYAPSLSFETIFNYLKTDLHLGFLIIIIVATALIVNVFNPPSDES